MVLGVTLHRHDRHWRAPPALPAAQHGCRQSHNASPWRGTIPPACIRRSLALAIIAFALAAVTPARGQDPAYELFIEGSPVDAGKVSPDTGSHRFSPNSTVTLTASPQPGYRFAYWLGDVSDPHAERTTIIVNESKVVVAVFHPEPKKRIDDQIHSGGGGGGGGDLVMTATDLNAPAWSLSGGGSARGGSQSVPVLVPVIVTPEPTTLALLGLGILTLRRWR